MEESRKTVYRPAPASISVLDDYSLLTIFEKLNLDDLCTARNVCQRWRGLATRCFATKKDLDFSDSFQQDGRKTTAGRRATTMQVNEIAENCNNAQELVLGKRSNLEPESLSCLLRWGTKLTYIDLSFNDWIPDTCFDHLGPEVTVLNIAGCSKIDLRGFDNIRKRCSKLTVLTMDTCEGLTSQDVRNICNDCTELRKLSICNQRKRLFCRPRYPFVFNTGLGDIGLAHKLTELYLACNPNVDDYALFGISRGCPLLEVLDLYACADEVSDDGVESFRICRHLRSLDISYIKNVTDRTLFALAKVGRLEEIQVRGNKNITSKGCLQLLKKCPRLRLLDVSGCSRVMNSVLDASFLTVRSRRAGPELVVAIGGTRVDVLRGFDHVAHPLLRIISTKPVLCCLHSSEEFPDSGGSDTEDEWRIVEKVEQ